MKTAGDLARSISPPFVVLAERQTAGIGRRGNHWASPPGGLWFTIVFPSPRVSALSLFLVFPFLRVLDPFASGLQAKWPNDLYAPGKRKLGGILVEVSHWVFAGVGINVNNDPPPELRNEAISLAALAGCPIDREALLTALLEALQEDLPRYQEEGFAPFRASYEARLLGLGNSITVTGEEEASGILKGVQDDGCLILQTKNGIQPIASGTLKDF